MLVEYRHKVQFQGEERCEGCRRNEKEMMEDLTRLVKEVNDEGIEMALTETVLDDASKERNDIMVNEVPVREILKGITIVNSCGAGSCDTGSCSTDSCSTCGTPNLDWIEEVIEDIPEHLLKMAISKMIMEHMAW